MPSTYFKSFFIGLVAMFCASTCSFAQNRNLSVAQPGSGAGTEDRIALIIGNSAYKQSPLFNPVNDASDLATSLERRGFRVLLRENVSAQGLQEAVDQFASFLKRGGVGLFFFAGHGVQVKDQNFLVPVDVGFGSEAEIAYKAISAEYVLSRMAEAGNRVNIVVLDACRDNPFQPARSAKKGLAQMSVGRNEKGTFIAYATSPGSTAADGEGRNGMYTKHLLKSLDEQDSDIDKVFGRVRSGVVQDTDGAQVPWTTTSVIGSFFFDQKDAVAAAQQRPTSAPAAAALAAVQSAPSRPFDAEEEKAVWTRIEKSQNAQDYREYLDKFPSGPNAAFARFRLSRYGGATVAQAPAVVASIAPVAVETAPVYTPSIPVPVPSPVPVQTPAMIAPTPLQKPIAPAYVPSAIVAPAEAPTQIASIATTPILTSPSPVSSTSAVLAQPVPGSILRDCSDCPEMVVVPPGQFVMGVNPGAPGYDPDEGPARPVRINAAFAVGKFEVTRAQFSAFLRDSGYLVRPGGCNTIRGGRFRLDPKANWQSPGFSQTEGDPVVCINWNDAKAYIGWLARKTGKSYRLLSESEWEYAARAGTSSPQYWAEGASAACRYASVADISVAGAVPGLKGFSCTDGYTFTAPAGRFLPNAFGLHDMLGNVWEWVEDCWGDGYKGVPADGSSATGGVCTEHVFRGGSWNSKPSDLRAGNRDRESTEDRHDNLGFRVARSLP